MIRSTKRKPSILRPNSRRNRNVDPRGLKYMEWVRTLPCLVCDIYNTFYKTVGGRVSQTSPTEAAHIGGRSSAKASNMSCIPLCTWHHRGGSNADSQERKKMRFFKILSLDYQMIIAQLHRDFEEWEATQ